MAEALRRHYGSTSINVKAGNFRVLIKILSGQEVNGKELIRKKTAMGSAIHPCMRPLLIGLTQVFTILLQLKEATCQKSAFPIPQEDKTKIKRWTGDVHCLDFFTT